MSTFRAGTRSPVNFSRHGRPEPKSLLAASCAAVIRLLPCSGVGCPSLIRNQADRLVLDGGETRLSPGPWTTRQQGSDGSDQALHESQYGHRMGRVNERPRRSGDQRQVDGVIVLSKFTSKGGSLSCCVTEYHQGISSAPLASGWRGYFVALWRVSRGNKSQTFRQLSNGVAMDLSG